MMEYVPDLLGGISVSRDVPAPKSARYQDVNESMYGLHLLDEIGMSVMYSGDYLRRESLTIKDMRVRAFNYARTHGWVVTTKQEDDGLRVWRMA